MCAVSAHTWACLCRVWRPAASGAQQAHHSARRYRLWFEESSFTTYTMPRCPEARSLPVKELEAVAVPLRGQLADGLQAAQRVVAQAQVWVFQRVAGWV